MLRRFVKMLGISAPVKHEVPPYRNAKELLALAKSQAEEEEREPSHGKLWTQCKWCGAILEIPS